MSWYLACCGGYFSPVKLCRAPGVVKVWARMISCLKVNVWSIFSILIGIYFLLAFHLQVGFPPTGPLTSTAATYLGLFAFFVVLPFAQRLKVGKIIEFERKVEQVREDVKEVRTETRELISTVSTVASTISATVNNQNVIVLQLSEELRAAKKDLSESLPDSPEPTQQEEDIRQYVEAGDSDVNYALARLRMDLEREIREILDEPPIPSGDPLSRRGRATFLTARLLFRQLGSKIPRYAEMQSSFDYLINVCNAAIHGHRIPEYMAHEAIGMGLRILRELKKETKLSQ